jgi:hypothetical protein
MAFLGLGAAERSWGSAADDPFVGVNRERNLVFSDRAALVRQAIE